MSRIKKFAIAVGVIAVVASGAKVAEAAIPSTGGVIKGCYDPRAAFVRVVDPALGQTCTTAERALDWNQTGPQGPAGPQGPQGPAGPAGGYNSVRRGEACAGTCTSQYYDTYLEAWAGCPSGTTLVGGGFEVVPGRYSNGTRYPVQVQKSAPVPGYDYWVVGVNVQALSYQDLKVYAMCVAR